MECGKLTVVIVHSLVSETIPCHRDYQAFLPKERSLYKKVKYSNPCRQLLLLVLYVKLF